MNRRPTDYESVALPAELHQHIYFLGLSILLSLPTTGDLLITNQLLYRLSYISIFTFGVADLILTNQLLYRLSYISIFTFGVADLILTNQLLYQLSYTSIGNDEII